VTLQEARETLLLFRPGTADALDPQVAEALALARQNPELQSWFEQHCAFQTAMRAKLRETPVPAALRERILAERKIVRPGIWWQQPVWLAAACLALMLGGACFKFLYWDRVKLPLQAFQSRMIYSAVVEYHMDVVTNEANSLRSYLARRGAPADYQLPAGMARLNLLGGGVVKWHGRRASMVCLQRLDQQATLFLFVLDKSALADPPPAAPVEGTLDEMTTLTWSSQDKAYFLAGQPESDFLKKYF